MLFRIKHTGVILLHHLYRCTFVQFIELMQREGNQAMLYSQHILGVMIDTSWHAVRKRGGKDQSSATVVGATMLLRGKGS